MEDLGIDGNMKIDLKEVGWIDLAQYTDKWRTLVNAVQNLTITKKNAGNFLTS